ncbi:TonB-dependent receptor [Terriglobus albidus]|uniref:TonB-dependent receptor n=1 Tax=Terriglobus albidus TaxID=1592106 RepID=UPI0021DFFE02|nr:carboxypeptidase regulatory-like domain-containing protein [Terriglobus albidus]
MKIAKICSTRVFAAVLTAGMLVVPAYVATPRALAQTAATGTISGTITDASGAAVPNTTVVITNTDTGASRTVTTNSDGYFTSTFLQPGHYEVLAGGTGNFGKIARKNLTLTVGQMLTVDSTLPAASVSTDVTVLDVAPLIETEKTSMAQTVSQQLVSNLPVNGRRWDNFVLLTPNVVPDGNSGLISYRGISGLYNTNLVDGTNNQQAFFSEARGRAIGAPYVFSLDTIKEFQSSTSGYSAEFGGAAGGVINAITKSGTNATHGDLFYYLRYPTLNALDPLTKYTAKLNNQSYLLTPTVHQQQQFGASIGGPIIKDKLFYFITYDGFRKVNPIFYLGVTPSTLLAMANNTYSTAYKTCPTGVTTAQCVAAANYIISQQGIYPRTAIQDIVYPRLDYQFNDKNHVSVSYNFANFRQPNGYRTDNTRTNESIGANGRNDFHQRYLIANWESVLSSNSANAVHFQWSRDLEVTGTNAPGPSVSISNILTYGETLALPRGAFPDEKRLQFADTYSTTHGKHSIKAGVDLNFIHEKLSNLFQGNGNYTYSQFTGQVQPSAVAGFYNWVQDVYGANGGRHYTQFIQVNDPITHVGADDFWIKHIAGFAEDQWKIRSDFTFTAGVRYDVQLVNQPPQPYTNSYNGVPSPLGNSVTNSIFINKKMIQPRLGFAWSPVDGMVVRGGYGMFYALTPGSLFYCTRVENGVFQQQFTVRATSSTATGTESGVGLAFPTGAPSNTGVLFTPPGPALAAPFAGAVTPTVNGSAAATPLSFRGQDKNFTNPYTHSFDLAVEQQLPLKSTLTVAYVGTRGMRLPFFIDANLPHTSLTRTYTTPSGGSITVPFYSSALTRPSPNDGIILVGYSGINTWYHSGAFTLRKQMSQGVELLANYTWSKAIDGSQVSGVNGTFNGTNPILDPYNLKNPGTLKEYGRSDLDMRGRFVGSIVIAPKFGFSNHLVAYAANGWTLSSAITLQDGLPLTARMSASPSTGVLDGGVTGGTVNLNAGADAGRAPHVSRNAYPSNGIRNIDARLSRSFPIHENIRLELLTELFNVANRRQMTSFNTTAFALSGTTITNFTAASAYQNFGQPSSTSSVLYGPRQAQFSAKVSF